MTENLNGLDYLLGASEGLIADSSSGTMERVAVASSSSALIRESYSSLTNENSQLSAQNVTDRGYIMDGSPMVTMSTYTDSEYSGSLSWRTILAVPISDYYDFVW